MTHLVDHGTDSGDRIRFRSMLLLACLMFLVQPSNAQNQNNNWYFGNRASISFSSGSAVPANTSQMTSLEGCASVSDRATGDLLFYTNGLQIWDRNNTIMPNGSGLLSGASTSATQGVLIVPFPGNADKYLVFTVDERTNGASNGFRYSIVDMTLNNGSGDVIPSQKNLLIQTNTTERMAVITDQNGTGYWIVIHERDNDRFKAYSIDATGLGSEPVVSNIGSVHSATTQPSGDATMGCMKFSPDGTRLAVAIYSANRIEIFDFDGCSGTLTNATSFETLDNPYGVEFSPDNSKLYYSIYFNAGATGAVYQLNLASPEPSPQIVGVSTSFNQQSMGALQLAPDEKIYISINSESWLSVIDQPDNIGAACGFIDQAIALPDIGLFPTTGIFGLPALVLDTTSTVQSSPFELEANGSCSNDSVRFGIIGGPDPTSIEWDFGILTSSNDTASGPSPSFVYASEGSYTVSALVTSDCITNAISLDIQIQSCDPDPAECAITIPTVFTPNRDGINDDLSTRIACPAGDLRFFIYNRWGQLVWSTTNVDARWDGTHDGGPCPEGVYFYTLSYRPLQGALDHSEGTIMLLR